MWQMSFLGCKKENDISRKNFLRKEAMLCKGNIILIAPSSWLMECAMKSKTAN